MTDCVYIVFLFKKLKLGAGSKMLFLEIIKLLDVWVLWR